MHYTLERSFLGGRHHNTRDLYCYQCYTVAPDYIQQSLVGMMAQNNRTHSITAQGINNDTANIYNVTTYTDIHVP